MSKGTINGIIKRALKDPIVLTFIVYVIVATLIIVCPFKFFITTLRTLIGALIFFLVFAILIIAYYDLSERIENQIMNSSLGPLLEFFVLGFSLTVSGTTTTFFVMYINFIINLTGINLENFKDTINFYVQISLNFLLGGITVVGASLPVLQSLLDKAKVRQYRRFSLVEKAGAVSRVRRKGGSLS